MKESSTHTHTHTKNHTWNRAADSLDPSSSSSSSPKLSSSFVDSSRFSLLLPAFPDPFLEDDDEDDLTSAGVVSPSSPTLLPGRLPPLSLTPPELLLLLLRSLLLLHAPLPSPTARLALPTCFPLLPLEPRAFFPLSELSRWCRERRPGGQSRGELDRGVVDRCSFDPLFCCFSRALLCDWLLLLVRWLSSLLRDLDLRSLRVSISAARALGRFSGERCRAGAVGEGDGLHLLGGEREHRLRERGGELRGGDVGLLIVLVDLDCEGDDRDVVLLART